jgi:hypothetical protein
MAFLMKFPCWLRKEGGHCPPEGTVTSLPNTLLSGQEVSLRVNDGNQFTEEGKGMMYLKDNDTNFTLKSPRKKLDFFKNPEPVCLFVLIAELFRYFYCNGIFQINSIVIFYTIYFSSHEEIYYYIEMMAQSSLDILASIIYTYEKFVSFLGTAHIKNLYFYETNNYQCKGSLCSNITAGVWLVIMLPESLAEFSKVPNPCSL